MILTIRIETTKEEFKRCIAAAWQSRFDEELPLNQIKDFLVGDAIAEMDIESILMGSSLGELVGKSKVVVKVIA